MYTFSTAVLIQAVVLVLFSSFADHGMSFLPSLFMLLFIIRL
jgi:hypothetical protein